MISMLFICSLFSANKKIVEVEFRGEEVNMLLHEITLHDDRKRKKMSLSDAVRRMSRIDLDILPSVSKESGQEKETDLEGGLRLFL